MLNSMGTNLQKVDTTLNGNDPPKPRPGPLALLSLDTPSLTSPCYSVFIMSDIQVEHSSTGTTCKLLGNLFSERCDAGMLDGDSVEGFETVDGTNGVSFFLRYAEPARAVRGIRALVYAGIHLCLNDFADLIIDPRRYQNVLLNPGGVCDDGDFDWREKVLTEVTVLGVVPSEPFILERHEMV